MSYENYVLEAVERVLALDIPDALLGHAVSHQAASMANVSSDHWWTPDLD